MVKKLYKQEMLYYIRSLLPVCIILMGLSVLGGIIHIFESDHWVYSIVANTSLVTYILSLIVTMVFVTIFIVVRYYKNMFTGEGYLTLTLPVTFEKHLTAKILGAMTASVITTIVIFISGMIFLGKEWIVEIYKAVEYLTTDIVKELGGHFGVYIVEFVILISVAMISEILTYYMCISLGQMFRKRRILAAIAIYYGLYIVGQIIITVISIVVTMVMANVDPTALAKWMDANYIGFVHGCMIGATVISLIFSAIMFLICSKVLEKRLNLE